MFFHIGSGQSPNGHAQLYNGQRKQTEGIPPLATTTQSGLCTQQATLTRRTPNTRNLQHALYNATRATGSIHLGGLTTVTCTPLNATAWLLSFS